MSLDTFQYNQKKKKKEKKGGDIKFFKISVLHKNKYYWQFY